MTRSSRSRLPTPVIHRNIDAMLRARARFERQKKRSERIADVVTRFTGSMTFVGLHVVLVGAWLMINSGVLPMRPFDPFPYVMLAMIASVEAIFLSTFVLISQNRMMLLADRRAELDLQINLLSEHEITRLLWLVDAIARHHGIEHHGGDQIEALKADVPPEVLLDELDRAADAAAAVAAGRDFDERERLVAGPAAPRKIRG